jgi:hypothetical protein
MAVNAQELEEFSRILSAADAETQAFAALRGRFPHLAWTCCDAADVDEAPLRTFSAFDLHLLDTRDHCPRITADPAQATGVVLAKRRRTS